MKYFYLEPEVAGGLGRKSIIDTSVHPPIVSKLHYQMDGWSGDVLLTSFPCFIIVENAGRELREFGLTGVRFDEVEVTKSDQFDEFYPGRRIPKFAWLRVQGQAGTDDFGIAPAPDYRLVVSERALEVLKALGSLTLWSRPLRPENKRA
jgi:hypothetical protein